MKTKILSLIIALVTMVGLSSCGCFLDCGSGYDYYSSYNSAPFGYVSGKITKATKTRVAFGNSWMWQDLQIYRRGMVVEVYRGNKIIRRYDMRYEDQEIDERFNATNLYGEAVSVLVKIHGFNQLNVVYCYCGTQSEHWFLT